MGGIFLDDVTVVTSVEDVGCHAFSPTGTPRQTSTQSIRHAGDGGHDLCIRQPIMSSFQSTTMTSSFTLPADAALSCLPFIRRPRVATPVLASRIFSVAVFYGEGEELVGFAIGRTLQISKMESMERSRLGILDANWNPYHAAYVLTLGVLKKWQKQGVASELIARFELEAKWQGAQFVFLHVITYNEAAIHLYQKFSYVCKTRLHNFYHIRTGRQPEPRRWKWDAFLFVKWMVEDKDIENMQQEVHQTCLGWNFCFPFNAKCGNVM